MDLSKVKNIFTQNVSACILNNGTLQTDFFINRNKLEFQPKFVRIKNYTMVSTNTAVTALYGLFCPEINQTTPLFEFPSVGATSLVEKVFPLFIRPNNFTFQVRELRPAILAGSQNITTNVSDNASWGACNTSANNYMYLSFNLEFLEF